MTHASAGLNTDAIVLLPWSGGLLHVEVEIWWIFQFTVLVQHASARKQAS